MMIISNLILAVVFAVFDLKSTKAELDSFCHYYKYGRHPHPNRCDQYVVCSPGHQPQVMDCPLGPNHLKLFFNPALGVCDYRSAVQCGEKKIEDTTICYGAKDDAYGEFIVKKSGYIKKLTLKHKSGSVSCLKDEPESYSKWGCSKIFPGKINIYISVNKNKYDYLFPHQDVERNDDYFYNLLGKDGVKFNENSDQIYFYENYRRVLVTKGDKLELWYGEDLFDFLSEVWNDGRHCVTVDIEYFNDTK